MRTGFFAVLASLWTFAASAEEIPGSRFSSGAWDGAAFTDDRTGKFDYCSISASYRSGDSLYITIYADSTVSIGFSNPVFRFNTGESFPVALKIDGRRTLGGRAVALSKDFAVVTLTEYENVLVALQRGSRLRLKADTFRGHYSLRGTSRAVNATADCVANNLNYAGPRTSTASQYDKSLLYQIATGMISETGVTDFKYMSDAETEELGFENAVFWTAPSTGLVGGVFLMSTIEGQTLQDNDSGDIEELTRRCKGDVISGAREVKATELPTREIRVICTLDKNSEETIVSKIMIEDAILYTMLVFIDHQDRKAADGQDRRELSEDVTVRAASFLKSEPN
ncbi:hypothetical protein [Hoeflea sp. TYP-13]|uniref:hypothetical protein n=1 Tax=Hoeflea sp. TYP-13 TaxID=3230023 RepID=UPI0034C66BFA